MAESFFKVLASTTCLFYIRLSVEPDSYLDCDTSNVPHLMKGGKIGPDTNLDMRKFLIYPEPGRENQFRIQLSRYLPSRYVESSGPEGPFKPWKDKQDSDHQLFRFVNTSAPANAREVAPQGVSWYLIERVAGDQVLTWGGVLGRYAHAMTNAGNANDGCKVWFEPLISERPPTPREPNRGGDPPVGIETPTFISQDVIPAALVNPPPKHRYSTKAAQIQESPYYFLDLERFWKKSGAPVQVTAGRKVRERVTYVTNYREEDYKSIRSTIGHTFRTELEAGYKHESGAYGSLKMSYQLSAETQDETRTTKTTAQGVERWQEVDFESESGKTEEHQAWKLVERYTLKSGKGEEIETWDYADPVSITWVKKIIP